MKRTGPPISLEPRSFWAQNILVAMERKDISILALARRSGVGVNTIRYSLSGERDPTISKVAWLAETLGYTLSQITLDPEAFDALD